MKVLAVIPARHGSTRLSEKPLREIGGKTLVQRVWEQATKSKLINSLYVATDNKEIFDICKDFGAVVKMTSQEIPTGSARVAEVAQIVSEPWDIVLNVQGDMPFINPEVIDQVISFFELNFNNFSMATIAIPIYDEEEFKRSSAVKVVISDTGRALYFSRAPIPHSRDGDEWKILGDVSKRVFGLKHIGLYAFKRESLDAITDDSISLLEGVEKLEQLKLLEKGMSIGVCIIDPILMERSIEVDTEEDLKIAQSYAKLEI